jgi:Predicted glycosyltransferases
MNISVCIATYNGEKYIKEQLDSILVQLGEYDEVIIGDDGSTDLTLDIIKTYNDPRIKIYKNSFKNLILNFESTLEKAKGEYIFLSDQDDVWLPNKVKDSLKDLCKYDVVISNCKVVNKNLDVIHESFFEINNSKSGLVSNLIKNSYLGCCFAFRKKILKKALPFPKQIPMHDIWLGFVSELFYKVKFNSTAMMLYRRHGDNESAAAESSPYGLIDKIKFRTFSLMNIINLYKR